MTRGLKLGDRVRLKPPARMMFSGWRGTGTIICEHRHIAVPDGYVAMPDDLLHDNWRSSSHEACDWQWAKLRDQRPNPDHALLVEHARRLRGGEHK